MKYAEGDPKPKYDLRKIVKAGCLELAVGDEVAMLRCLTTNGRRLLKQLVDDANRGARQAAEEVWLKSTGYERPVWVTKEQAEEMLKGQDTYSCSTFEGFKPVEWADEFKEPEADQPTIQEKQ